MKKGTKILLVYEPENQTARALAEALEKALPTFDIAVEPAVFPRLIFEIRKNEVAHFFTSGTFQLSRWVRRLNGHAQFLQTLLTVPDESDFQPSAIVSKTPVVLSEDEKQRLEKRMSGLEIHVIPPVAPVPDVNVLHPPSDIRRRFNVGERLMVLSLNDVVNEMDYEALLYIMREFDKRGRFRLVIPQYRFDKNTVQWRSKIHDIFGPERLQSSVLLPDAQDADSMIDSCDVAIHFHRGLDSESCIPQLVLEALSLGKPVLAFDQPPLSEVIGGLNPKWICKSVEDFVGQCRNFEKDQATLEQFGSEIVRFARSRFDSEKIASLYRKYYEVVLH